MRGLVSSYALAPLHSAAARAAAIGGALNVDKSGRFLIEGRGWVGRKVLWLKQHLFPSRVRAQNMKVLSALARVIDKERGERGGADLLAAATEASAAEPLRTAEFARSLAEAIERLDVERLDAEVGAPSAVPEKGRVREVRGLAQKAFDDFITEARGGLITREQAARAVAHRVGYGAFMVSLADSSAMGGRLFTPGLCRAVLLTVLHKEGVLGSAAGRAFHGFVSRADYERLGAEYDVFKGV